MQKWASLGDRSFLATAGHPDVQTPAQRAETRVQSGKARKPIASSLDGNDFVVVVTILSAGDLTPTVTNLSVQSSSQAQMSPGSRVLKPAAASPAVPCNTGGKRI